MLVSVGVGSLLLLDWAALSVCRSSDHSNWLLRLVARLSHQSFVRLLLSLVWNSSDVRIEPPDWVSMLLIKLGDVASVMAEVIRLFLSAASPHITFSLSSRRRVFRLLPFRIRILSLPIDLSSSIGLHKPRYSFRVIDDKIINIVVVDNVCDLLPFLLVIVASLDLLTLLISLI